MEPQPPRWTAALVVEIGQGLLDAGEGRLQRFEKASAGVGQGNAARGAMKQANVELLLEMLHGMAQRRAGDSKPGRAGAKAQHFCNGDEGSEVR